MTDQATTDVAVRLFSDDDLRDLRSWDDIVNLASERDIPTTNIADVLGDGFSLLDNKTLLLDVPFVIVTWTLSTGDIGEFATVRLMTRDGRKLIINDGSTGIRDQIKSMINRGVQPPTMVVRGLRVSRYSYTDPATGKVTPAETFYLNTAAE